MSRVCGIFNDIQPISRLIAILDGSNDCGVICKLQMFNSWVGSDLSQPHLLFPVCQEAGDPLTDGRRYIELVEFAGEDFRDDNVER